MKREVLQSILIYGLYLALLTGLWMSPVFLHNWLDGVRVSLWRSGLLSLCISSIILLPVEKWLRAGLYVLMCVSTSVELFMVKQFGVFLTHTHTLAMLGTNPQETNTFLSANWDALYVLVPFIMVSAVVIIPVCRNSFNVWIRYGSLGMWLLLIVSAGCFRMWGNRMTSHEIVEDIFIERVPINFWENMYSASAELIAISHSKTMTFGAYSEMERPEKEVVVLAIGESVRYHNFSMNGHYDRQTTPLMQNNPNAVLFSDYTTTGCITMLAVPMILTRGTPENFDLTYKECGVQRVFQETGFYTVALSNNLIGDKLHKYLLNGADEVIPLEADVLVPDIVDSISRYHPHLFVYFQLSGSHAYYENYTEEFNRWRPNSNSDKGITSDSLLYNAYDNTILYTDNILNDLLEKLNIIGGVNLMFYISDHGETITATNGWHGAICDENEVHIPFVVWASDEYIANQHSKWLTIMTNKDKPASHDNIFYTLCGMSGIALPLEYAKPDYDLSSTNYKIHRRTILHYTGKKVIQWDN